MRLLIVALGALVVAAALPVGQVLVVSRPLPHAGVILPLASHEWERLPLVLELAETHPDARVLLTRPRVVNQHNCHACDERPEWLAVRGVDEARIHVVRLTADGTYAEAQAALAFTREHAIRSIVVATSPYHTRRALAVFRTVFDGSGVEVGIVPASAHSVARPSLWWIADYDRRYVPYEWAAMAYYTWHHGMTPAAFLAP